VTKLVSASELEVVALADAVTVAELIVDVAVVMLMLSVEEDVVAMVAVVVGNVEVVDAFALIALPGSSSRIAVWRVVVVAVVVVVVITVVVALFACTTVAVVLSVVLVTVVSAISGAVLTG